MHPISELEGWLIYGVFGALMLLLVRFGTRPDGTKDQHLVANRDVSVGAGALSIAASWIWAPAVFLCSQKAYEEGLPGLFWFTVPNVATFFTFAVVAVRARRLLPAGYSLPDLMWLRFGGDRRSHVMFLLMPLGYDLGAIVINTLAGGLLMQALTGIPLVAGILALGGVALSYAVWRALPGSVITDVVQMAMILVIGLILTPWAVIEAGGLDALRAGLGGVSGDKTNVLDPWVAYSFGIPASLGLIAGPIADQMFFQRAWATRPERIVRTFVLGGLVFGVVPVLLSAFGFLAANPAIGAVLHITDPQMVSVAVAEHFLPRWTLFGFAVMALCALSSTLDSAYIAMGSLFAVDVYARYLRPRATDLQITRASRLSMIGFMAIGTAIAIIPGLKLLWVFLIYGAVASAALAPTVLALYWSRLSARGAFWGAGLSFALGLPLSIYANATENAHLIVAAAVASVAVGLVVCVIDGLTNRGPPFAFRMPLVDAPQRARDSA